LRFYNVLETATLAAIGNINHGAALQVLRALRLPCLRPKARVPVQPKMQEVPQLLRRLRAALPEAEHAQRFFRMLIKRLRRNGGLEFREEEVVLQE
jgi:hypothetical protein